jgi:hypothetical protein
MRSAATLIWLLDLRLRTSDYTSSGKESFTSNLTKTGMLRTAPLSTHLTLEFTLTQILAFIYKQKRQKGD